MFNIATAPFAHNRKQTRTLMLLVILACVPGLLAQTWFFGWGSFIQILLALVTALLCEALVLKLRGRAIQPALMDGSAALTAVLIGLSLPPLLPWWMLVVGGAGSLYVAPGVQLVDTPQFPTEWKNGALAAREALNLLRQESTLQWTFLSPAILLEPGERTGHYRLGTESPVMNGDQPGKISVADLAVAIVDELEAPRHLQQRFTVAY